MNSAKAQVVISSLISSGFTVQAQPDANNDWTIIVKSDNPITSQVVENFRNSQQINATVTQVVFN